MPKEPNYRQIEKKILDDVLSPDVYDPRIRPAGLNTTGETTNILVKGLNIVDIFRRTISRPRQCFCKKFLQYR